MLSLRFLVRGEKQIKIFSKIQDRILEDREYQAFSELFITSGLGWGSYHPKRDITGKNTGFIFLIPEHLRCHPLDGKYF